MDESPVSPVIKLQIARQEARQKARRAALELQRRNQIEPLPHLVYREARNGRKKPVKPKVVRS